MWDNGPLSSCLVLIEISKETSHHTRNSIIAQWATAPSVIRARKHFQTFPSILFTEYILEKYEVKLKKLSLEKVEV